ncbi:MAG: Rpn family recombination-promoting nuclease/putative transposase [Defluviitaleaceae bacterium]|nr:Rpn family recombination-promoting nuclease/putative transposase [Defluviitaleaceae bacterium]MCL2238910.1 Rpn family recombination-promoting nuclease/putative transposase [Defluviitaleaceae bacterium]
MTPLKFKMTHDLLFKMLFVKYPDLLRKLVAVLLDISYDSITKFTIANPEIPPEMLGDKFCRLDINMVVNGQRVDLEVQVENEGNYPERSLFIWAKEYSTGIGMGENYKNLPRTIVISILGFNQFADKEKYHHEFQCLEVTTHAPLTDKMALHFYELKKLPPLAENDKTNGKDLWLKLFRAETEEDLAAIEKLEVPEMSEALQAYRHVAASDEFKEKERMWAKARHDEAQALYNAEQRGAAARDVHWQGVAEENERLRKRLAELEAK